SVLHRLTSLLGLVAPVAVGLSQGRDCAIYRRRAARVAMEHHREMAAGAKAHRSRDRVDREIALDQERARALDAPLHHEAVGGQPCALLEEPREVILAQVSFGAQLDKRERAGEVIVYEFRYAPKLRPRQAAHGRCSAAPVRATTTAT